MYNSCKAPIFLNYGQAKEWHDKVPPVRGRKIPVRPLGARRYADTYSIEMRGEDVAFLYGGEPVVIWHIDDSLTIHRPKWCSAFEPDKLAHYLPPRLNFLWDKGRFILSNQCDGSSVEIKRYQPVHVKSVGIETMGSRNLIVRKYETQNKPVVYKYEKKRGVVQRIMKAKFQPFLDWVDTVVPIHVKLDALEHDTAREKFFHETSDITPEQWKEAKSWSVNTTDRTRQDLFYRSEWMQSHYPMAGRNDYSRRMAVAHEAGVIALYKMMLPENQHQWFDALQIIAGRCCRRVWNSRFDIHYLLNEEANGPQSIQKYLEDLICMVDRGEVFVRKELPAGTLSTKRNEQYFTFETFRFFEETDTVSVISANQPKE